MAIVTLIDRGNRPPGFAEGWKVLWRALVRASIQWVDTALFLFAFLVLAPWLQAQGPKVIAIEIDGPIGPATADYVARVVDRAGHEPVECLIICLDTPGGL